MIVKKAQIYSWETKYRLKFINSLSGYKGVHLIGTKSKEGISNLGHLQFNSPYKFRPCSDRFYYATANGKKRHI